MHGDFSKLGFRPERRYSAVLAQQGRLQLDSDANEQVLLDLHRARTLAADLIGRHGGPRDALGFGVARVAESDPADLTISPGRYYVDGVLVDATRPDAGRAVGDDEAAAPRPWTYWDQPDAHLDREGEDDGLPDAAFVVYLRVVERLVTHVQDPAVRETALGPALLDTAARLKVAWQVLAVPGGLDDYEEEVAAWRSTALLAARTERPSRADDDPCLAAPDARYRGEENQLYRVEVHTPDAFKWSRENGSVVFGVAEVGDGAITLTDRGRDGKLDLDLGDWVELLDDAYVARDEPGPLVRVTDVDTERLRVEVDGDLPPDVGRNAAKHPFLRRWDQRTATVPLRTGEWLDLEDGVQVWFAEGGRAVRGDHWLIPARTLTGDVEWPADSSDRPLLRPPQGVVRHFAALAVVNGGTVQDLRNAFPPLGAPVRGR
ncbi:DUF6519 domain-containing protein [Saccharothrix sp. Mg75]|uniref:DUF6519 domain-containing protein n=1 Tax=Saccharothrix sp. Mg75 TaxID=3445357 RepID=UPI003EEEFCCF